MNRDARTIIKDHLALTRGVIDRVMKRSKSQEEIALLDRLKKRITLLLQTMGDDALIVEMSPYMQKNAENILSRNEEFFLTVNAREEYIKTQGRAPAADDEFVFLLIDSIRSLYRKLQQREKDELYAEVVKIFNCCIEYQIVAPERFAKK